MTTQFDIEAIRKSLKDTHAKIDREIKANAAQKFAAQRKIKMSEDDSEDLEIDIQSKKKRKTVRKRKPPAATGIKKPRRNDSEDLEIDIQSKKKRKTVRKRKPPAATGIKKPRRKAKSTKPTETKTLLLEKIKEHNSKAILKIPPNANLKQLETIFANRPIVYKRRPKLSTQERQALQQAKKDGDKALTEKINKLRKANAIKQSQRNDAIIAKYGNGNNNPKPPQVKDLKPITKAPTRRITPIMMSKAPTRRITPIMIK